MLFLRSLVFNLFFYCGVSFFLLLAVPLAVVNQRRPIKWLARAWAHIWLAAYRVLCGVRMELRGAERIPDAGALIVMKHQSTWETFALYAIFRQPVYVLKEELMWIPVFGWIARALDLIPVKRGAGKAAVDDMIEKSAAACRSGFQIVIFPEGTRVSPGETIGYKKGCTYLYEALNVPCVPVALNSGLVWPRRRFLRPPGKIVVEILEPIPPGLSRRAMYERMVGEIESAAQRLARVNRL